MNEKGVIRVLRVVGDKYGANHITVSEPVNGLVVVGASLNVEGEPSNLDLQYDLGSGSLREHC